MTDALGPNRCTHCLAPVLRFNAWGRGLEDREGHPRRGLPHRCDEPVPYPPSRKASGETTRAFMQRTDPVSYQQCRDAGRF